MPFNRRKQLPNPMNFTRNASSTTTVNVGKQGTTPMMFTSFEVPKWAIPLSAISDTTADKYMHLFTSFEVPTSMFQGIRSRSHSALKCGIASERKCSQPRAA